MQENLTSYTNEDYYRPKINFNNEFQMNNQCVYKTTFLIIFEYLYINSR